MERKWLYLAIIFAVKFVAYSLCFYLIMTAINLSMVGIVIELNINPFLAGGGICMAEIICRLLEDYIEKYTYGDLEVVEDDSITCYRGSDNQDFVECRRDIEKDE